MSVVVSAEANGNYEPSEGEIIEYGKWLGMKLPEDNPFLWIAREGLKAPLPENWKACQSDKGELYYFNFKTGQSIWDHPMDEHFKELFKSEKQNPTPRSIAAGAKRKEEATPAKKEGKSKKKQTSENSVKPVNTPAAAPTSGTASDTPQSQSAALDRKEGSSKVQPLKTVKIKKELPKEMRLDFDSTPADRKSSQRSAPVQLQPAPKEPSDDANSVSTQDDSSEGEPPKVKPKPKVTGTLESADPEIVDNSVGRGGSGLKSLRILSENNNRNSPPNDSVASEAASAKAAAALADATAKAAAALAEEKEKLAARAKEEIETLKAQLAKKRQQEEEALLSENAKAIKAVREKCEKEKEARLKEVQKSSEEALKEEQRNLENELKSVIEQARKDMSAQKSTEIRRLKDHYKEQFEQEKKKLMEEHSEKLEAFAREQRDESDAKKGALSQMVKDSEKLLEGELKHFSSSLIRSYEESYVAFLKATSSSQNDFALRSVQQKEEAQRELDSQLAQIRSSHQSAVESEKKSFQQEVDALRAKLSAEKARITEENRREIEELKKQAADTISDLRTAQEQEAMAQAMADLRASQAKELEALKIELRKKAEDELRAAMAELSQERRAHFSVSPSQHDTTHKDEQTKSPSLHLDGDETGGTKPPSLDGNLLRSSDLALPDAYAVLRDNQAKDIKSAITEALREVFAESPFTLPSPSRGSVSLSPSRQDAQPTRRSSVFGNAAVAGASDSVAPVGLAPTRSLNSPTFSFPVSFQEQRDLVEGERLRVREGRRFVETQRKSLEERRQQLRRTRHQWKQDVIAAKEEGVRSSSKRGQLLNKVRIALEEQSRGLEHDEAILHESMGWLQSKEQRLMQLEQQIEEQERMRLLGDNSTINCSVDTAALVTGYFKPTRGLPTGLTSDVLGVRRMSQSMGALSGANFTPFDSPTATPVLSSALSRIERRLDEVTSLINLQKAQAQVLPSSPQHHQPQQQAGLRRISLSSPTTVQSQSRRQSCRSHSKAIADGGRENHVDPW